MYRSSPLPRRRARLVTTSAVLLLGSVIGIGLDADPVAAAPSPDGAEARGSAATPGACTTAEGVTVIIDFQELGGGSYVRCAPNSPRNGFEALEQAGISYTTTTRSPGFLCRIAGKPAADGSPVADDCRVPSPTTAYWSYWLAPRGGYWCYANFGAGNRRPPAGTVEGWSFSLNKTSSATPPPSIAPPDPLPGIPTTALPGKDCTVPTEGAPPSSTPTNPGTPTTRPYPGSTTPSPGAPSNPSGTAAPSGPATPSNPTPRPGGGSRPGSLDGSAPGTGSDGPPSTQGGATEGGSTTDGSTSITGPSGSSTSTAPGTDGTGPAEDGTTEDPAQPDGVEASGNRGITDPAAIAALEGDVDLGDDGRSKGSPVPLVAAGVVATGLVAGGIRQRRRSRPGSDPR